MEIELIIKKFADAISGQGDYVTSEAIKRQIEKILLPLVSIEVEKLRRINAQLDFDNKMLKKENNELLLHKKREA